MEDILNKAKLYLEVAAYGFGALFLLTKLVYGDFNAGMEVAVELHRAPNLENVSEDNLSVLVKLKRNHLGRIEIKDLVLKVSNLSEPNAKSEPTRNSLITTEREVNDGRISDTQSANGIFLPPGDATQLAYLVPVKRGVPILVDATVLATRTGPWFDYSQWRASAISLPVDKD